MPKYTFECQTCHNTRQIYTSSKVKEIYCDSCGKDMLRNLPTLSGKSNVRETVDNYTGLTHSEDQRVVVEQRRDEYYWSVDVPRLVNSGTYSVETMFDMGWVYFDEKNQIQVNTKPPHKR